MRSLPDEIWEHVNGSEENVEISTMGRVRKKGKLVNKVINKDGYYVASFGRPIYRQLVHRQVAKQFIPNDDPENKTVVDHIDGNKLNNAVSNLRWLSPGDNTREAVKLGLIGGINKKGFIVIKEVATGIVKVFDTISRAAFEIKGDEKQLNQVINGSRKRHAGHSAYRVEEDIDSEYYTLKIQKRENYKKKDYRQMVLDCLNNINYKDKGEN